MNEEYKTAGQIKYEQEAQEWDKELAKMGRHDLIKDRVGTIDEAPSHYNVGYPPVKYIQSHGLDFLQGSIVKYVTRCKLKGSARKT